MIHASDPNQQHEDTRPPEEQPAPEQRPEPAAPPPVFLDAAVRAAQAAVEQKFLFRKIGLPFDYASSQDDFPSKCFATAKEARSNQPNPSGLGAGFHFTCRNHSLLFDSYLLRLELGVEGPGDEAILDRLIGGLIRLATVAPKSFLVGGLAPDGRGFYGQTRRENHIAWAFAVTRGLFTAAIAPESQEKFRSIAGKWMDRIRREKYRINTIDGKPAPAGDISQPDADSGPFLLAILLTAARSSGDARDFQAYETAAEENERARLQPFPIGDSATDLLWRQAAWSLIAEGDPVEERKEIAKARLREHAVGAVKWLEEIKAFDPSLAEGEIDLNWRSFPKAPLQDSPYGFAAPESWRRLDNEAHLENALSAALAIMLAGDAEILADWVPMLEGCLRDTDWSACVGLNPVACAIAAHARGVELGLWDGELYTSRREPPSSEISIAAKYLEDDYDDVNREKSGHSAPPAPPPRPEGAPHKRRRRKKRRS